jgi:hypothetical protein
VARQVENLPMQMSLNGRLRGAEFSRPALFHEPISITQRNLIRPDPPNFPQG